jgi:hypothetical protein
MGGLVAMRQSEVVLPLRIGQRRAQVKLRVQAVDQTQSLTNAEVALKHNNVAAVAACARIAVIAAAIVVMTFLRLGVVAAIMLQA